MKSSNLREKFDKLVDCSVKIKHAYFYINPLMRWQVEEKIFHHVYNVFYTSDSYWWSIEKNTKGITLQRSLKEENVRDLFGNEVRIPANSTILNPQLQKDDPGKPDAILKHLIDYVLIKNCLESYNFFANNCIHFGNGMYYVFTACHPWK